jgi:hypothetical protein
MSIANWVVSPAAKASRDSDAAVRRAAVGLLGAAAQVMPDATVAAPLAAALKDDDFAVRRSAAGAMVNIAQFAPDVTAALAEAVKDRDQLVRVCALRALGSAGASAKDVMPVITAALKDPDPDVRVAAANALGAMQMAASVQPQQPGAAVTGSYSPAGFAIVAQNSLFTDGGDANLVDAANIWHWTKVGRLDLAKADADQILKRRPNSQEVFGAFMQAAQDRREDLGAWLERNRNVAELKELVAMIDQTMIQTAQPATEPAR